MAEIGRLLSLPPPAASGRPGAIQAAIQAANQAPVQPGLQPVKAPATQSPAGGGTGAAEDARDQTGNGRAKAFRFRVYDGGRPDESLAGNAGLPARDARATDAGSTDTRTTDARATRARTAEAAGDSRRAPGSAVPAGGFSAPFLAQLIAQEQLRPGLYDPPLQQADRAYRQAGGEPALADGGASARFRLAV